MLTPIIAFAKDWHEDPTSNHHVLRELAKTRRVLWLNSLATRTPKLSSGRDLGKIKRKLGEFAQGPQNVENDLWVMSPLVLPLPHSRVARTINRQVLRATIRALRLQLGIKDFQLWTFLPSTADYVGTLGEALSIYYCVDEWSLFSYLDKDQTVEAEHALLERVDAVFAINHALADAKRLVNPNTFVSPHGVDHALFARALDDATEVPADIASLPHPRIGFYGTLQSWVDFELIAEVARQRPAWSIILIGQQLGDLSALRGLANVHLLGQRRHDELPAYCKGFDVGVIPYRIDERMKFVNPLKLREYLSAGLPVVSTAVPEVKRYPSMCEIATTPSEFVAAIERALADTSLAARSARSATMQHETWAARVAAVTRTIDQLGQLGGARVAEVEPVAEVASSPYADHVPFLVTGASGSLGTAIVKQLRAQGHLVRVFQRRAPEQPEDGLEYAFGDLGDPAAVDRAVKGAQIVIHCGAATKGDWLEHRNGTVVGTQNVIDACKRHGVKQLVHISSMSVVDWAGSSGKAPITEATNTEPRAASRGAYTRAKLEAEQAVRVAAKQGLPVVILRPGQIFGGGIPLINGAVARPAGGRWLVLGDGKLELPLVYIDDVVDAVMAAIASGLHQGELFHIIDPEHLTQDDVLELGGGHKKILRIPRSVMFAIGRLSELPLGAIGRPSPIGVYRLKSALARLHYESDHAAQQLGWKPRVGVREGIRRVSTAARDVG
ncbi:MAG: NAD-dependent epimerase/dehydratase family protein [Myxococcales bacterium]|nr:NAD-dependent epimerase/dehydratase family protein [Myxococcales bacterium]